MDSSVVRSQEDSIAVDNDVHSKEDTVTIRLGNFQVEVFVVAEVALEKDVVNTSSPMQREMSDEDF